MGLGVGMGLGVEVGMSDVVLCGRMGGVGVGGEVSEGGWERAEG